MDTRDDNEAPNPISLPMNGNRSPLDALLIKWARTMLVRGSANNALRAGTEFKLPKFLIFRAICDVLEMDGRVLEAVASFQQMGEEPDGDTRLREERAQWVLGFQRRCTERLRKLADAAMGSEKYKEAADHFSTLLSLGQVDRMDTLLKRSNARVLMKLWDEALVDADEVIKLDPSCHRGYEMRHSVLHAAGRYVEAVKAFETMLSTIEASSNEDIRNIRARYVDARPTIRRIVEETIRTMPLMLIDTTSGRLYDKRQQAVAFETLPIYSKLLSSMTETLDYARIRSEVEEFYQYVMFSHRWWHNEPLFSHVKDISIYDLPASPANTKLQSFSSLARALGFQWAWTDSSCVNKLDHGVLQESLVAMFSWYRGSSLTVVYLHGVLSESQQSGDLLRSIWNTRAWTCQEYVAAETVQFYTEDWKPYLGLTLYNHKKSPVITSEMEQAIGVSAQEMAVLQPGLNRAREKLYLVSRREATRTEDIAYCLLGIFKASIPIVYGEGYRAVGRLLEYILAGTGDVTILAWTGRAGSYNSCLPHALIVYDSVIPPHVPRPIEYSEMDRIIELRSSLPDLSLAVSLYDRLCHLPSPSVFASRLILSGFVFPLVEVAYTAELGAATAQTKLGVCHATTAVLGDVEIRTVDDLSRMEGLCLVHPWIQPLLDQEFAHDAAAAIPDDVTQALRFVTRLRQPFGALLLEQLPSAEYRRVATDSLIMVQIREEASLTELLDSIRTIEIL